MSAPRVELICAGSELLDGQVNTHESYIGLKLRALGLKLDRAATIRDDLPSLSAAAADALGRCDALIMCGGLGPTFDDLTREAASAALGRPLVYRPALFREIERRFARHKIPVPEENKRQAFVLEGAEVIPNAVGSAPGQLLARARDGRPPQLLALLPGPYSELAPMLEATVLPRLNAALARGLFVEHAVYRMAGLPESLADEKLAELTARPEPGVEFTILAGRAQVDFHVRVTAATRAKAAAGLQAVRRRVLAAVGGYVFGEGDDTLESVLGQALMDRGLTLAVAESCTGGLVGGRLTAVPGSSRWFRGGVIAYDNSLKERLLGVSRQTLAGKGAVSLECAREMAEGARRSAGADIGLAVTGVAGPGGGTKSKPVGLVCLAVAGPGSGKPAAVQGRFGEGRALIRERSAAAALALTLRRLRKTARGSA